MNTLTITAGEVQVGDRIYNAAAFHEAARWLRVVAVERITGPVRTESGAEIVVPMVAIQTTDWTTYKTIQEGIAVQRNGRKPTFEQQKEAIAVLMGGIALPTEAQVARFQADGTIVCPNGHDGRKGLGGEPPIQYFQMEIGWWISRDGMRSMSSAFDERTEAAEPNWFGCFCPKCMKHDTSGTQWWPPAGFDDRDVTLDPKVV